MFRRNVGTRQCDSNFTVVTSRSVSSLLRISLFCLIHRQLLAVQGQSSSSSSQKESLCTIESRPVLVGLTSDPEDDWFGNHTSLSFDGTIAAIGTPWYESTTASSYSGSVQVVRFENSGVWTPLGSTIVGDPATRTSPSALSEDGSILAVGGWRSSHVRVFRWVDDDDDWKPFGNNITNPNGGVLMGSALAFSGDGTILAASSPSANSFTGEVLVFELVEGTTWSQKGSTLQGQGEEHDFGWSVSLSQDGSRLAVGIPDNYSAETKGFVRVFEFADNNWIQIGQTLEGTNFGDEFGKVVSLSSDGQTLAVGAPLHSGSSFSLGSVHIFRFGSEGQWFEPGSMLTGKYDYGYFGESAALSGDASILVARAVGLLRFFEADGNEWIEVGEEATDSREWNYAAISRDGTTAMGGASVFDISCPGGGTPDLASPVLSPRSPTTRAPTSRPTSTPIEATEESLVAVPVLSPSPTGRTEPPADNPIMSRPTSTPIEASEESPIAVPVLSPPPTGRTEPPVDTLTVSSPTFTLDATKPTPTSAPRTNPTAGTMVQVMFSDISLTFNNVSLMSEPEIETFERLTKTWYEAFFDQRTGSVLQSLMLDVRNMQTTIEVANQNVNLSVDGSFNKITYKQTIAYTAESNTVDVNDYITLPFVDVAANAEYGATLKSELVAFQGVQSPLPTPQFETVTDAVGDENDGEGITIGVIVGASIGGAVILAIAAFVRIRVKRRKDDAGVGQSPPSAAGVIVYDEQGETLGPRTLAAQAVLLASDNPTTLQKDTTKVQTPSAGSLEPSPPVQGLETPMQEPTAVFTPSNGYMVQFKDQAGPAAPERLAQRDPQ